MDIWNIYRDGMEFFHKYTVLSVEKLQGSQEFNLVPDQLLLRYWAPLLVNLQFQLMTHELPKCSLHWTGTFCANWGKANYSLMRGPR